MILVDFLLLLLIIFIIYMIIEILPTKEEKLKAQWGRI